LLLGDPQSLEDFSKLNTNPDPKDDSLDYIGIILSIRFERDAARYDALVKAQPDNFLGYYCRALVHGNTEQYDLALKNADVIRKLHPTSPLGHMLRGQIFSAQEKSDLAVVEYDQAIKLGERQPFLYYLRGEEHAKAKKRSLAKADFKKSVELESKY